MRAHTLAAMLALAATRAAAQVPYEAETTPVPSAQAADLAIFVGVDGGWIIGTDKMSGGVLAYGLDGALRQSFTTGPASGADFRADVRLGTERRSLAMVSIPSTGRLVVLAEGDGGLVEVGDPSLVSTSADAVALRQHRGGEVDGDATVLASNAGRSVAQLDLSYGAPGVVTGASAGATLDVLAAPAGMVVDDRAKRLYVSLPTRGIAVSDFGLSAASVVVVPDAGGLRGPPAGVTFYPLADGGGLVLVAVPSRDDVAVFAVSDGGLQAVTRFSVGIDGGKVVRSGAFLDVTPAPLPGFPQGLLAIHDPLNLGGANYKLVRWDAIANSTTPPLPIELPTKAPPDAGPGDGGVSDGGTTDGGAGDGGATDGGATDAGPRRDGGSGGGPSGGDVIDPPPPSCACSGAGMAIVPGVLLLLSSLLTRRRRTSA